MRMIKIIGFGILVWLIPFFVSFLFYRNGEVMIPMIYFKTLMLLIGNSVGIIFLYILLKGRKPHLRKALHIGILWFVINIALDFITIVPMGHMRVSEYFLSIGFRYFLMPIIAVAMDRMAAAALKSQQ